MGADHHGDAEAFRQPHDEVAHGAGGLRIKPVEGLVEQQHVRVAEQRHGQPQPLLHAEGEPSHLLVADRGEPHEPQRLLTEGRAVHDAPGERLGLKIAVGGQVRQQRQLLDEHADAPHALAIPGRASSSSGPRGSRRNSIALEQHHFPSRRQHIAADHLHDRRFASAVFAHEPVDVAGRHGHGKVAHHRAAAVYFGQPAGLDDVHARLLSRARRHRRSRTIVSSFLAYTAFSTAFSVERGIKESSGEALRLFEDAA